MISLYNSTETNFNTNGLVVLSDCISANITEELNGQYELEIEYPLDTRGKWQYLVENNIIKADDQLFRIYHKFKTLTSIKINARHIFYDLLDNFLEDAVITNLSGAGALDYVLTHTQYTHTFINMGDVGGSNSKEFLRKNPVEAIMGQDGIINTWGGELVRDNFTIKLLQARGLDRGVLVSYGKNIQGIEETLDTDSICTRIMPVGKDGLLLSEKYVDSPFINNFPHPKIQSVEFNDIDNEADLRTAATNYFANTKCDIPQFNFKIDFIELSKTEEYKNYAVLETVYMGDTVTIKHSKLNINLKAKVVKTIKNHLTGRIEKVELGSFKPNLATGINKSIQNVKQEIDDTKSTLQLAIDNATNQINNALGGYVVKRNGELLIMDTEDPMTATKVWRWNEGGLGYSGTGYNGPFRTAMTADGHIVADFMDTGTLNAGLINVLGLVVGDNVAMGANATISWGQVTNQPTIPKTAADVNARPDTWMPTAIDVGARPDTWLPTASEVGARPNDWLPTAAQINALATNWVGTTYIDSNGLYTGTIAANKILAGTITGVNISGGSLSTTPNSGSSVTVMGSSIDFKNNGSTVASIWALNGILEISGTVDTSGSINSGSNIHADYGSVVAASASIANNISVGGNVTCGNLLYSDGSHSLWSSSVTRLEQSSSTQLTIYANGTTYGATTWQSDISLKHNILDYFGSPALDKVMAFKHRQFDWNDNSAHVDIGYVSQELMMIDRNLVTEVKQPDGKPSLFQPDITTLIPTITKAMQEMQQEILDLRTELEILKTPA